MTKVTMDMMTSRASYAFTVLTLLSLCTACSTTRNQLVWSDEFNENALDTSTWEVLIGDGCSYGICGWGNNELQWYTDRPENVAVADGFLSIVAREDNWQGHRYTSARLRTKGTADFRYGRMEARLKIPRGQGIWPAFWMMPTESHYGAWPRSGEIDIMEAINAGNTVYGTLHYGYPKSKAGGNLLPDVDISETFNVYAVEWEPTEIRWYFNDELYARVPHTQWYTSSSEAPSAPFDREFHFILNIAVGGNWPGDPDETTTFPQKLVVDWVRVYRLSETPAAS